MSRLWQVIRQLNVFEYDRDHLVSRYFNLGFTYNEIVAFLQNYHGIQLSVRQLKRILKTKGLRRRGHASALPDV